jgi:hypothetical protein
LIFVDTGAFLARYLSSDALHSRATRAWKELERRKPRKIFTSHDVLDETLTLLARRANYSFAAERGKHLFDSETLEVLHADAATERIAISFFEKFADQRVSFTDCLSFALMRAHDVRRAFSFDRHFAAAGFDVWP